jgi:glucuronyl/N-acetylglucosaminyl transferase EXT2
MRGNCPKLFTVFTENSSSFANRTSITLNFRHFFLGFAYILLFICLALSIILWIPLHTHQTQVPSVLFDRASLDHLPELVVLNNSLPLPTQKNCTYYTCFDVYKCSHTHSGKIGVYVYPVVEFVDKDKVPITRKITLEFYNILKAITKSVYFTSDPNEACLFIPTIDLLNQNRIRPKDVGKALTSLP